MNNLNIVVTKFKGILCVLWTSGFIFLNWFFRVRRNNVMVNAWEKWVTFWIYSFELSINKFENVN